MFAIIGVCCSKYLGSDTLKNIIYIVIDESGATHQKQNNYFVIAGYITKQIYSVKSTHKKVEKKLKEKYEYLNKYKELKGCYLKSQQKAEFLNELFKIPTTIPISIIIDKRHLFKCEQHDENIKYNYFIQILLSYLLHNYPGLLKGGEIQLILDNRNVSVGSLNSLSDYLNSALGLIYNKKFKVIYRNSNEHREVQMADLISNVMFGYYNFRTQYSTYHLIPALKNTIISKFLYKYFKEPKNDISQNSVDNKIGVWYIIYTRPGSVG